MPALKKYRAAVSALVAYILLAIILTYPLILNFATHVPGDGSDDPALAWNLWWVPFSIINRGASPIFTDFMFYPIGLNLAFYTLTYLNAFLSIPFQFVFNVVIAANVNVLLSFALSGFGTYLLVKYLLQVAGFKLQVGTLAAFAAGAVYAFSSNKFLYASLGQFNIASSHWIPFYILFLLKLTNAPLKNSEFRRLIFFGFMLGLFLLFQALSEFIFASFLIIFTALYLVYYFARNHFHPSREAFILLPSLVIAALTFTLPMSPILAAMIQDTLAEGDFIQSGLGFADVFSSDALGFFVPSHLHPILGNLESQFHFAYINFAYLGFAALIVALLALIAVPRARIWGIFGLIFVAISLGPNLVVNGARYNLPMPFDLLLEIPFIKGNRYPSRWSVMVTLALAVLVGYGVAWLMQKIESRWYKAIGRKIILPTAYGLLLAAFLFEHLSTPLSLSNLQIPDAYQVIARDPGDFTVLEIPLAWRNGFRMTGTLDQAMMFAQFYQTAHRHPILGGNTSRNPELKFQYFMQAPVINSLIAVETGHKLDDATIQRDRQLAPAVLRFFGVRYIVWHSPRQPENRTKLDAARAYVQFVLPVTKISEASDDTGEIIVFRVNDLPPLSQTTIHANDSLARLNFGEGWGTIGGAKAWATRREAKMFVRLDSPRDTMFSLRAFAPMANQRLVLRVNKREVCALAMKQGTAEYSCRVAREAWRAGMNEIVLRFDALSPVTAVRSSFDSAQDFAIGKTGVVSPVSIVADSAGSEVGDFAHIFVNGVDVAQNARGYNIVVIDPPSGVVESRAAFDTFTSPEESARLAQFIDKIPTGRVVAVVVRDEASRNLTQEVVDALRSIGAQQDLHGKWRWSHAIIGVKGAPPPSALEAANEIAPAQIVVGVGAMEANVAAAVEWIKVEFEK